MSDSVTISELMMHVRIGCTAEERAFPQRLLLSACFYLDLSKAGRSGDLEHTICYATLSQEFLDIAAEREWTLLEEVAESLANHSLKSHPHVKKTEISIKKFAVPGTAHVAVTVGRSRE
jgi:FolB domain-containing protein